MFLFIGEYSFFGFKTVLEKAFKGFFQKAFTCIYHGFSRSVTGRQISYPDKLIMEV
ncbi:MAG: hypothetical protein IJD88_03510 [Clostridia bacterium]|nr:hypothetical protein [Clostridia bacterium]